MTKQMRATIIRLWQSAQSGNQYRVAVCEQMQSSMFNSHLQLDTLNAGPSTPPYDLLRQRALIHQLHATHRIRRPLVAWSRAHVPSRRCVDIPVHLMFVRQSIHCTSRRRSESAEEKESVAGRFQIDSRRTTDSLEPICQILMSDL